MLTHQHDDHVGSAQAVAQAAPGATLCAGAPDVPAIEIGREVSAVCVLDTANAVLIAGDALISTDGALALPSREFASDYDETLRSVALLGDLDFETAYDGREPLSSGAVDQVRALG